jgi:hypothetical protein
MRVSDFVDEDTQVRPVDEPGDNTAGEARALVEMEWTEADTTGEMILRVTPVRPAVSGT